MPCLAERLRCTHGNKPAAPDAKRAAPDAKSAASATAGVLSAWPFTRILFCWYGASCDAMIVGAHLPRCGAGRPGDGCMPRHSSPCAFKEKMPRQISAVGLCAPNGGSMEVHGFVRGAPGTRHRSKPLDGRPQIDPPKMTYDPARETTLGIVLCGVNATQPLRLIGWSRLEGAVPRHSEPVGANGTHFGSCSVGSRSQLFRRARA